MSYDVERGFDRDGTTCWEVVARGVVVDGEYPSAERALRAALGGVPWKPGTYGAELMVAVPATVPGVYRVVERGRSFLTVEEFVVGVRAVLDVSEYKEPADESAEDAEPAGTSEVGDL